MARAACGRERLPRAVESNTCQDVVGVNPGAAGSRSPAPPAMPAVPPPMVAPPPPDLLDHLIDCDRLTHRDAVGRHGRRTSQPSSPMPAAVTAARTRPLILLLRSSVSPCPHRDEPMMN